MVRHGKQAAGDVLFERQFGLQRRFGVGGQPYTFRYAEHMRIDRHHLALPQHSPQHVGRLAPHPRQPLHRIEIGGHLAAEFLAQHPGHPGQILRLVVRIGDTLYIGIDSLRPRFRHLVGRGEALEKGRRGHVDPLVGTLGRQDDGYQQLVGIVVVQFALGHGHVLRKPADDSVVTLSECHSRRVFRRLNSTFFTSSPAPSGQSSNRGVALRSRHQRTKYSRTGPW